MRTPDRDDVYVECSICECVYVWGGGVGVLCVGAGRGVGGGVYDCVNENENEPLVHSRSSKRGV